MSEPQPDDEYLLEITTRDGKVITSPYTTYKSNADKALRAAHATRSDGTAVRVFRRPKDPVWEEMLDWDQVELARCEQCRVNITAYAAPLCWMCLNEPLAEARKNRAERWRKSL